jgi:TolB-like protein/Flp pilus assembly protein TadD
MESVGRTERTIRFRGFDVDARSGELRKDGRKIKLQDQPFQVLLLLLEHCGEVVTREELRRKLWPQDTFVDFDVGLNSAVKKLREALGDSADSPRFIETLPRRGYRFLVSVETADPRAFGAPVKSLAVLPLENLSGEASQEYFADGMTDALITSLAQISALRVISRTSVMRYKGARTALPEIARELNVQAVVEGTVLRAGKRVRIHAQLIDARTDTHLWAEKYERPLGDILVLQSELAQAIAAEIRVRLTPQEQARLAGARLVDPRAYDAYLMGRLHWNRRTQEGIEKGLQYFRRSLERDPSYARAYAGVSDCYNMLGYWGWDAPGDVFPAAKEAALRALEIEETLGEAHTALAWVLMLYEWDWEGATRELKRALDLNPGYPTTHQCYGHYYTYLGRRGEAQACVGRTLELDPLSLIMNSNAAFMLYFAHEFELARAQAQKAVEIEENFGPTHLALGWTYQETGPLKEAEAELEKVIALSGGSPLSLAALGRMLALSGRFPEAHRIAEELAKLRAKRYVSAYYLAFLYAGLRKTDKALCWLEKACEERSAWAVMMKVDPKFAELHGEPRFQELLRRIGLEG